MSLELAFLLGFGGLPAGIAMILIGGLMAWRGRGGWRGVGWALVLAGVLLASVGAVVLWQIGQVNWGL